MGRMEAIVPVRSVLPITFHRACLELLVALGTGFIPAAALLDLIAEAVAEHLPSRPLIALGYLALFLTEKVALSLGA